MNMLTIVKNKTVSLVNKFTKNEQGVTAIEYAVVAAGVAVIVLALFKAETGPVDKMLTSVFSTLETTISTLLGS